MIPSSVHSAGLRFISCDRYPTMPTTHSVRVRGEYAILNVGFERVLAELLQLKRLLLCRGTLLGGEVGILPSFVSWMRRLGSQIDMGQVISCQGS
ncbi:hypothetical protein FOZ63_010640, partial [Perkinsus olseni]